MNDSDLAKLIQETNQGEQNRYGDIEYKLPSSQRISNFEAIAKALATIDPKSKALNGLPSLIYWALCDEITIVDACVSAFVPLADHPRVAEGFLKGLTPNLTLDFRHRFIASILERVFTKGNLDQKSKSELSFGGSWARLVIDAIGSWPVEEQITPSTQELVTHGLQKLVGAN